MSDPDVYDRLAKVLRDVHERFPEDGFTKVQRLRGLLSDHMIDAEREIRVTLDVIDEGVVALVTESSDSEVGMQVDRLVGRLDTSRGIRDDIARQVIAAFAYALGKGPLPSEATTNVPPVPPSQSDNAGDDWVGVSEVATPNPAPEQQSQHSQGNSQQVNSQHTGNTQEPNQKSESNPMFAKLMEGNNKFILIGVVLIAGYLMMNQQAPQQGQVPSNQQPVTQQPQVQPQNQQPVTQQPQVRPQNQPGPANRPQVVPQPQLQQPQQQQQQVGQATWYDDVGTIWQVQFSNGEFRAQNTTNHPMFNSMVGTYGQGAIAFELLSINGEFAGSGEGYFSDQTHIQYTVIDANGNFLGQGQYHVDHPPDR
ncbi:MAG: hypothetical protein AAF541_06330 [Pseudomonadota bacterium]